MILVSLCAETIKPVSEGTKSDSCEGKGGACVTYEYYDRVYSLSTVPARLREKTTTQHTVVTVPTGTHFILSTIIYNIADRDIPCVVRRTYRPVRCICFCADLIPDTWWWHAFVLSVFFSNRSIVVREKSQSYSPQPSAPPLAHRRF